MLVKVTRKPKARDPYIKGNHLWFSSTGLTAIGSVTLDGEASDSAIGWNVGFVQVIWAETSWAYYRGRENRHGSVFVQYARPPALKDIRSRDTLGPVNDIFYTKKDGYFAEPMSGAPLPIQLNVNFEDTPTISYPLTECNHTTEQINYLREAQWNLQFCTVFSARDPSGTFHHLGFFYWNVSLRARLRPLDFGSCCAGDWNIKTVKGSSEPQTSEETYGAPGDERVVPLLTSKQERSSNDNLYYAIAHPVRLYSPTWANFDIRK
ncbi:MAG TPA: hypothetical protein VE093_06370 [Polyangiaceae bacterium]|nr:hypothetical protein [Polyangiaceae bacterium]